MPDNDLSSFLERVREDAGQESMTHDAADCADWRNSCSAHNAMRLAGMVGGALGLADEWEQRAAIHEKRAKDLRDNGGMPVPAAQEARAQTHRADAGDIRAAITTALTEGEAGDD